MSTPCTQCQAHARDALWPVYCMRCATCCARLVRSARPLRHAQEGHFAAISHGEGGPSKAVVIAEINRLDAQAGTP